jgi:hypothetical protein
MSEDVFVLSFVALNFPQTIVAVQRGRIHLLPFFQSNLIFECYEHSLVLTVLKVADIVLDECVVDDLLHMEFEGPRSGSIAGWR